MKNKILALIFILISFWSVFFLLQNESIYKYTFRPIASNWIIENNERILKEKPYEKLSNENLVQWDTWHYKLIKESGYDTKKAGGDYIFAFFPLFPLIWKITHLPTIGILFLNYIFFAIGLLLLLKLYDNNNLNLLLISITFPGIVCFMLPYTEATFLLATAIGIVGYMKGKYWIYFMGMCLASMARPAIVILLLSFVLVELYYLIQSKNILNFLKSLLKNTFPIIVGTLIVGLIQLKYNSGNIFAFFKAQSAWDKKLRIPHNISDWSHEGFSMNIAVIFFIVIPILAFLILYALKNKNNKTKEILKNEYIKLLSLVFLIGTSLSILLYQNGNLHGLHRYIICSPFFFILLFTSFQDIVKIKIEIRMFFILSFFLIGIFCLSFIPYSTYWNFSDFGFFVFSFAFSLWLFQDFKTYLIYKIFLITTVFFNIIWSTYLFNTYISNSWIFT